MILNILFESFIVFRIVSWLSLPCGGPVTRTLYWVCLYGQCICQYYCPHVLVRISIGCLPRSGVTGSLDTSAACNRWRRAWQPTPVLLPGESHGQRSLEGYSPCGHKESDTTERLSTAWLVIGRDSYFRGESRDTDVQKRHVDTGRRPRRLGRTGRGALTHIHHHVYDKSLQLGRAVLSDSATPWTAARQASLSITNPDTYMV